MEPKTITLEEQENMGLRRGKQPRDNFVPAVRQEVTAAALRPAPPIQSEVRHVVDIQPISTQHVEMKTSAIDRAKGFLLATLPLCGAFALAVVGVCVVGFGVPWFSVYSLLIAFVVFVTAWSVTYCYTLQISAEGVSYMEAVERMSIVRDEQKYRWQAWLIERLDK